jgi:hypothetical protein
MSPSPTKTPKSTKDRGLKAKSDGCSGNLKKIIEEQEEEAWAVSFLVSRYVL